MGGDYTRFTFDPVKGFSGVLKQQGRVSLDSDANELEAILDRRARAEMYDTVGQAVYPLTTPDAFKISVVGGKLSIGQGRLYVDGILAECFGDMTDSASSKFDEHMNNLVGTNPLVYDQQPFSYTSPPVTAPFPTLSPTTGEINLVYLDVWQREVTVFEDYSLREIALNGPDTDTRVQIAWQVKVMKEVDASSCTKPPPAWDALIAPSTGRLTATAAPAAPAPGPCVISAAGGYTGLENRLYRVEIHTAGTVGGATPAKFKWSRDNASLAARVVSTTQVSAADWIITVGSTGRDSWMRFEVGDHVELLDDNVEFAMRETGRGGIMAKVIQVNHATGEVHVDQDLGALPVVAGRHARIRRWDAVSALEPFVRDTNNGVAVALENGISITFGLLATDTLRAGDHWLFAARTADGSIDSLLDQPPRNALHHFAKLALVTSGAPPAVLSDCRIAWPPSLGGHEGCCSQVVKVGEDIQKAIDKLSGIGGCVCLKMGVHVIPQPLHISQSNLKLHGEVPWVTVRLAGGGPRMLEITGPENLRNVSVEGIFFEALDGADREPMISVVGVAGGRIADCAFQVGRESSASFQAIGIQLTGCSDYAIESVEMKDLPRGVWGARECREIRILDSRFIGPHGDVRSYGAMGIQFDGPHLSGIYVERNVLTDYKRGIQLGEVGLNAGAGTQPVGVSQAAGGCRIAANQVSRRKGEPPAPFDPSDRVFAIATHVARCEIIENAIDIARLEHHGILVVGGNTLVQRNEVRSSAEFVNGSPLLLPVGVTANESLIDALLCSIRGNFFTGLQQAIVASGTGSGGGHRIDILDNRIEGAQRLVDAASAMMALGGGGAMLQLLALLERFSAIVVLELGPCRIAENEIKTAVCAVAVVATSGKPTSGASVAANRVSSSLAGVILLGAEECDVSDNVIDASPGKVPTVGVGLFLVRRSVAARNVVRGCTEGISSVLCTGLRVQDNDIYQTELGIASLVDTDLELRGNNIEDATLTGISAMFSQHELTLAHDRTLRCGFRTAPANSIPSAAIGIDIQLSSALVTVEGCHVIDTGESMDPAAAVFAAPRHGIQVLWAIGARIRGCEVVSKPLIDTAVNPESRAVRIWNVTGAPVAKPIVPFADATDNVIEQSVETLVEIVASGETLFATNRCTNFSDRRSHTVVLIGATAIVSGNRIRARDFIKSLAVKFSEGLSAVGNRTTKGALIVPVGVGVQVPSPYESFNVST